MKIQKKSIVRLILICIILISVSNLHVFAKKDTDLIENIEYTQEYKEWLNLSDEEKQKVLQPRMYEVPFISNNSRNPFYRAMMLSASTNAYYNLKNVIPNNLVIKNQMRTNSCWTFAVLSSLETNMAMYDFKNKVNTSKVYDFSERHMEYATSKTFLNNQINSDGYNREVGKGGNCYIAQSYLTNGTGAIPEEQMRFINSEEKIQLSEIQGKTVSSRVYDTVDFANYNSEKDAGKKEEIINQVKQHIQDYGSVYASIHGNSASTTAFACYNNKTAAKYCNNEDLHKRDHAVSIIGWDDDFPIENFAGSAKPTSPGAWIVRNSWGEKQEYDLTELKQEILQQLRAAGRTEFNSVSQITDEMVRLLGFTIEGNKASVKIGDNGLMYVSYEDCNVSQSLWGIIKSSDAINYEHIYQYDEYYPTYGIKIQKSSVMLCNVFDRETDKKELLTHVSLYAPEQYTCRVYVNSNGDSKLKKDVQLVNLKSGESKTIGVGYHTLEFEEPVELTGNKFAVIVEITESNSSTVGLRLEARPVDQELLNCVSVEKNKCFLAIGNDLSNCSWQDTGTLSTSKIGTGLIDADSTIKAFTTSKIYDESLESIKITKEPNKKDYFEGENFNSDGMEVTAYYNSITKPSVVLKNTEYTITDGTSLKTSQTNITISYNGKIVTQPITVQKNIITSLQIAQGPTKTQYKEGEDFESSGMQVKAIYKDGSVKDVTDYTVLDGKNLKLNQTEVTISYDGLTVKQTITVEKNLLKKIIITKQPDKVVYMAGEDFDSTGMVISGELENGSIYEIKEYEIQNGKNLKPNQTEVTISYGGLTVKQTITVKENLLQEIIITKQPNKVIYIAGEDFDSTGMVVSGKFEDGSIYEIKEYEIQNGKNLKPNQTEVIIKYEDKTTTQKITVEEKAFSSNIENISANVKKVKVYYFTNETQNNYVLVDIEIDGIVCNMNNDNLEYYYYLSENENENEQNIENWVKITEVQNEDGKLKFVIDSNQLSNYVELISANEIYLYLKEVATGGEDQSVVISKPMKLEANENIEIYKDNVKYEGEGNSENFDTESTSKKDSTTANKILPYTGKKLTIIVGTFIVIVVALVVFIRYNKLKDIK